MATTLSGPNGGLLVVCILLCLLIPAFTFYGKPSLDYGQEVGSELVAGLKSSYGSWREGEAKQDPTTTHHEEDPEYLAICLAVRDQALDLPEFLQHHHYNMGVGRFYILDDGSNPPLSDAVDSFGVPPEVLTFVYYDESQRVPEMQYKMYDDCARVHAVASGRHHTWLAFIDADEFLDTPGGESLVGVLQSFEATRDDVGALAVNWQMHTSNGLLRRAASVRWSYTHCIYDDAGHGGAGSDNRHVKSIVRVRDYGAGGPITPHMFHLAPGKVTVGEDGATVDSPAFRQPISRDRVSLHHYAVKSREEYVEKMKRSNAMGQPKDWQFWNHVEHDLPHVLCDDMVRWLERDPR
ncbi:hypothetical protein PFICI_07519 [Pestalotiopsis fici W106-1]|uniref:Glycosyltransferase family 92 protein n=1 Tax=Pestalotiopsis fici (strain W106-1 / CGMCC3.15140) TaxID=1229662 RepID=W3X1N8_PESFW|nr:uncharacterized protein PFICI_07519 [Pestalotiopsis fici W106-1]ETS79990.1 hypothetical protein PFICI_07519 [Pestalotiopsis fici W106-1]